MFINESMSKNVITIDSDTGVLEAKGIMAEHHIRHLPVTDEDNKMVGIVTDRDIRSTMPSVLIDTCDIDAEKKKLEKLKVTDIMATNIISISPLNTLEDAILLMHKTRVGAFPVVDEDGRVKGIISIRDLMRAFVNVLGIKQPGTLLCILVEDKVGQMKKIVDAITEENIPFGSILVARYWEEGKRAVFPYLLTNTVAPVKRKLQSLGFEVLEPMEWYLDQLPKKE